MPQVLFAYSRSMTVLNLSTSMTRQILRGLLVLSLIAALVPGVTVLCVSRGHMQIESLFASCCHSLPTADKTGGNPGDCADCSDVPLLCQVAPANPRLTVVDDQGVLLPTDNLIDAVTVGFGSVIVSPSASLGLIPTQPTSSQLRC